MFQESINTAILAGQITKNDTSAKTKDAKFAERLEKIAPEKGRPWSSITATRQIKFVDYCATGAIQE